jgi:hypothetical protein
MPTVEAESKTETSKKRGNIVEMSWDPITRIVGSLGIYTKLDFENKQVVERSILPGCVSFSSRTSGTSFALPSFRLGRRHASWSSA